MFKKFAVLALSVCSLVSLLAARNLSSAFMVDTGVVMGPASGSQYSYGAASNGNGWRVMWSDDNDYSLRTSGIDANGALLDPRGSPVGHEQYWTSGLTRSIVGTGAGYIAVWPKGDSGIWGAKLDSAGALVHSFLVFKDDSGQTGPAVAFDGDSTCLVVWTENSGNGDIYATRVTTSGHVLDPAPIQVAAEPVQYEEGPAVAFGRGVYLVTWTAYDTGYLSAAKARRVSADGIVLDTAIFLRRDPTQSQVLPAVAFGDTCFLTSWSEGARVDSLLQVDIYAARVSVSGSLIDPAGIQLSNSPNHDLYSSIAFDGTRYLVMWQERDLGEFYYYACGRRVTADGVPLDPSSIRPHLGGYSCDHLSVAADHANFLVACTATDTLTSDQGVGCVRISPNGAVLDTGIFFPSGPDVQSGPSGASSGYDFLAAWFETGQQGSVVSAGRIGGDGEVLDPVGFPVNIRPGNKSGLATGFGDSLYLVAWADHRNGRDYDVYCARVNLDGQVLDTSGIAVCCESLDQENPGISFDGQNFLVVWQDVCSRTSNNIYAARVSLAGVVLDPNGFAVAAEDTFGDAAPAACFTNTDHLVVWQGQNLNTGQINIYGALVSPAGAVVRSRFLISGAYGDRWRPTVARAAGVALVAWEDSRCSPYGIFAARVRYDGTVTDSNGLCVDQSKYNDGSPRVTSDGVGFKVLWRRYDGLRDTTHLVAAKVDAEGNVLRVVDWFRMPGTDSGFDAVQGSGSDLLSLFSCRTDTALGHYYGADRLWANLGPMPGIAQADNRQARRAASGQSIIRGVLFLPEASSRKPEATSLLDVSGRKVMELRPGANDVSRLAPGVYFVREAQAQAQAQAIRKVVITR